MSKSMLVLGATALSLFAKVTFASYIQYSTVAGFFQQDNTSTVASTFDYTATNFGLISQIYDTDATFDVPAGTKTRWERFENKVVSLQAASPTADYKVLFIGRHGEGYHNVAETFYGTPAWNCYWAELDGNGTVNWADAHITPNGVAQAQKANAFWASQIANQKQTIPQSFYTSPLTRCLETAQITWAGLTDKVPTVKELFREGISQHTCDRRSNKTYIHDSFPTYNIEAGFTEYDELWRGVSAETQAAQDVRSKTVLDEVFSSDASTYMSITTHSGEGGSILRVLGHIPFSLVTGAVIPVLVKAETLDSAPATSSISSWTAAATCTVPPITSLATGGCVCPTGTSTSTSTSPTSVSASVTSSSASVTSASGSITSSASASTTEYTTSTVRTTSVKTIYSCAPTVTNCPADHVTTVTIDLYTTVCPVTASETPAPSSYSTSVFYTTSIITIYSCAATVTDCPARKSTSTHVITTTIPLYTATFPVSAALSNAAAPRPTSNSTIVSTKLSGGSPTSAKSSSTPSSVTASGAGKMAANLALLVGFVVASLWL